MRICSVIEMVSKPHCLVVQLYEGAFPYHFYFVLLPPVWAFLAYSMFGTHQTPSQQQHFTLNPPSLFAT